MAEIPLKLPLDAKLAPGLERRARGALDRAKEVGEEYESVEVETTLHLARSVGAGILEMARRTGAEAIVMGGEPPSRIRGGAVLGGIGREGIGEVGEATEYVLKKASCQVLLTAPPEASDEPDEAEPLDPGLTHGNL